MNKDLIYKILSSSLTLGPILDMGKDQWSMAEVEEAWAAYKARAASHRGFGPATAPKAAPKAVLEYQARLQSLSATSETVVVDLPPLARDDLEERLNVMGRGRRNPAAAQELKRALKKPGKLRLSPPAAAFVYEELLDAKKMLSSPAMANDPFFQYQLVGIKQALKNMRRNVGAASAVLDQVLATREALLDGAPLKLGKIRDLCIAAANVLRQRDRATGALPG